jgi:thiosulfate sulfurtransferase
MTKGMAMHFVSTEALAQRLAGAAPVMLLDVRKAQALDAAGGRTLPGAQWQDPALWLTWKDDVPADRLVVVYCAHGQEISQALTTALCVMGRDAVCLRGGYAAWAAAGLPTVAPA